MWKFTILETSTNFGHTRNKICLDVIWQFLFVFWLMKHFLVLCCMLMVDGARNLETSFEFAHLSVVPARTNEMQFQTLLPRFSNSFQSEKLSDWVRHCCWCWNSDVAESCDDGECNSASYYYLLLLLIIINYYYQLLLLIAEFYRGLAVTDIHGWQFFKSVRQVLCWNRLEWKEIQPEVVVAFLSQCIAWKVREIRWNLLLKIWLEKMRIKYFPCYVFSYWTTA